SPEERDVEPRNARRPFKARVDSNTALRPQVRIALGNLLPAGNGGGREAGEHDGFGRDEPAPNTEMSSQIAREKMTETGTRIEHCECGFRWGEFRFERRVERFGRDVIETAAECKDRPSVAPFQCLLGIQAERGLAAVRGERRNLFA